MTKEEAKQKVSNLVSEYQKLTPKKIQEYSEADTRRIFIMPLFHALGWDTLSRDEVAEEVKVATGRVDFVFKLNGVSQFYLETKALRADLTRADYQKQAITYAYNKGITWALLSDFEGLQVINAQTGRPFITLSCDNYVRDFEDLWLLSKDSFQTNALNESAEKYGALPQRLAIEQRLYNQLRQWREELYNQIHAYNKGLKHNQIDEVIQRLFNRLIFIRNCEDRQIEDRVLLGAVNEWRGSGRKEELIERLQVIFRDFDGYYDSDLFAYHMTDEVFIEGVTIEHIIDGLYEVPGGLANYDFSVIDADVLGAVYEQYLGHVADAVKRRAKEAQTRMDFGFPVEETFELTAKKQRRKEHGIYYTPKYISDYIVKETVGRFLQERTHDEILNLKILDPACGSGSFLIRAYDELLNYHSYQKSKPINELDQWERLSILTGSIFGVDLDMQAVEIAHLNLLLRSLAKRELLPSLKNNIRQGNSLISGTEKELKKYFGNKWRDKKPLIWEEEFKDIMANGGFDIVIGNPPYVNESRGNKQIFRDLKSLPKLEKYYEKNMDLFNFFVEVGLDLLKDGGFLGYIIPAYWQDRTGAKLLRRKIVEVSNIERLVDLGEFKVFEDAPGQHSNILILQKVSSSNGTNSMAYIRANDSVQGKNQLLLSEPNRMQYSLMNDKLIIGSAILRLNQKLQKKAIHLQKEEVVRGVDTSPSSYEGEGVFVVSNTEYPTLLKGITYNEKEKFIRPFYEARQIDRYYYEPSNHYWLIYTDNERKKLLESDIRGFSVIKNHLDRFADIITSDNKPYGLHRAKKEVTFLDENKIMFVRKTPYPKFVPVTIPYFVDESIYIILWNRPELSPHYLLGLLNSKLAWWWFSKQKKHGGQLQIDKEQILSFPIFSPDTTNREEKDFSKKLAILVKKIIGLHKRLAPIRDTYSNERDALLSEIEKTDKEIDNLVYDLYGLTKKERKIIEEVSDA